MKLYVILAAIFLICAGVGIVVISGDDKPDSVVYAGSHQAGYEDQPDQYTVTASPKFIWHNGGHSPILLVLGCVLIACCTIGSSFLKDAEGAALKQNVAVIIAMVISFFLIFGKYVTVDKKGDGRFSKTVSKEVYEANKNDLNALFK
jgi:hypothetical protein